MNKKIRILLYLLLAGVVGIALSGVYLFAFEKMMSYEAREIYEINEGFSTLEINANRAQITVLPEDGSAKVEVYAKAWLLGPMELSEQLSIRVEDEKLVLNEIPFPDTFLGTFPQPYEMTIAAYVPQSVYDRYMGGKP